MSGFIIINTQLNPSNLLCLQYFYFLLHLSSRVTTMAAPSQYTGLAATWTLKTGKAPPTESVFLLQGGGNPEAVFQPDHRAVVDQTDYKDGGKYRCEYHTTP